jgi:Lrp/AsnC family leucine-responsive transcriptional regulator
MKNGKSTWRAVVPVKFDQTDRKIIGVLGTDGRIPLAELGRRVNLSPPAVAERVQRLEHTRVITGYRAIIDPRALTVYDVAAVEAVWSLSPE